MNLHFQCYISVILCVLSCYIALTDSGKLKKKNHNLWTELLSNKYLELFGKTRWTPKIQLYFHSMFSLKSNLGSVGSWFIPELFVHHLILDCLMIHNCLLFSKCEVTVQYVLNEKALSGACSLVTSKKIKREKLSTQVIMPGSKTWIVLVESQNGLGWAGH